MHPKIPDIPPALGILGAALTAAIPHSVIVYGYIVLWLLGVDMVTGIVSAVYARKIKSKKMRDDFAAKLWCYFIIMAILSVGFFCTHIWGFIMLGLWAIMCAEVNSLLENFITIQQAGNVSIAPLSKPLAFIAAYFDLPNTRAGVISTTATVIPSDPKEPVIVISSHEVIEHPVRPPEEPVNPV